MFVRCNRCSTDYEFDDALISERGTLVRCTNCDEQFKVYPPAGGAGPERWVVRTSSGRELVYTSLRELQRGIASHQVGSEDVFTRGRFPARTLGSVAELSGFFHADLLTPGALVPPSEAQPPAPEIEVAAGSSPDPKPKPSDAGALDQGDLRALSLAGNAEPSPTAPEVATSSLASMPIESLLVEAPPTPEGSGTAAPKFEGAPQSPRLPLFRTLPKQRYRESLPSYDQLIQNQASSHEQVDHARSRWIAGVVLLALSILVGATVGRRYLTSLSGPKVAPAIGESDPRVAELLAQARHRIEEGEYEAGKEQLDKASALSPGNSAVLIALARLETLRTDMLWLKLRLLDTKSLDLMQTTRREFGRRLTRAEQAVTAAFSLAPEDPDVVRARIDVLRLAGETDKAREWFLPISARVGPTENAYVLAALDLAEAEPVWPTVVERLRVAASTELESGRAHAALILALVRAQRLVEAEVELGKLESSPNPHILLEELRHFVRRQTPELDAGASRGSEPWGSRVRPSNGFAEKLERARILLEEGDSLTASRLYKEAVAEQPDSAEAWSALGKLAHQRQDSAAAARMYERALEHQPSYLPALMALADLKWESGDRKGSNLLYRRALEQASAGTEYALRASARVAQPGEARAARGSGELKKNLRKRVVDHKVPAVASGSR